MKKVLIPLLLGLGAISVWAEQVSWIDRPPQKVEAAPVAVAPLPAVSDKKAEPRDEEFDHMKEFMRQEDERIKAIKILNLDLERADLELKKREIEVKLA